MSTSSPAGPQVHGRAQQEGRRVDEDEARYLEIYLGHFRYVGSQLRRLGIGEADLPDVTQDVFVVVHRRLGDFDPERPIRPWLFGILFRVAADWRRLHRRTRELLPGAAAGEGIAEGVDPGPRPDDALLARQARDIAGTILAALDPRLRVVLVMHDLGGIEVNEVATRLGIPRKTVYTRLRLARARFAAAAGGLRGAAPARGAAHDSSLTESERPTPSDS